VLNSLVFHSIHTAYTPWLCSLFWMLQLQYAQHFSLLLNSYSAYTHSLNFHNYLEFNIYFYYVRIKEWTLISQLLVLFLLCSIFIKFLYIRKFFVRAFTSLCTTLLTSIVIPFLLNKQLITMLGIVWNNYGSWKSILQHQRYDFWDITFFLKLVFLNSMYSLCRYPHRCIKHFVLDSADSSEVPGPIQMHLLNL